ncbi:Protein CBG26567 [Caenorhabditis briggsae]|uniref:Protein CBG26567 n=1 Tax=Caenorhabditis briggsae TaxID=6238 RepID=B6IH01_CAEBR|nr:Protein CBG26567 [Caenorhabditis briggsae]CAR99181.1 Protein CBG26567 [Caenorhabditis briggsae]
MINQYLKILQDKIRNHIRSVDSGNAILFFCVSAITVFLLCVLSSPTIQETWHQRNNRVPSQNPRGIENKSIPEKIKSGGKRKRRFAKKDIRAMEMEEKQRKKEEKKEESRAERLRQKQTENGQQKKVQKASMKKNSSKNAGIPVENRQKKTIGVMTNVPTKRS